MSRKLKRNSEDHGSAPTPITRPTTRSAKKLKVEITEEDPTEESSVSSSMSGADSDEGSVELGPPEPAPHSAAVNGDPHMEQHQQQTQPSVLPSPPSEDRVDSDSNVIVKVEEKLVDVPVHVPVEHTSCMDTSLPTTSIKIEPDSDSRSCLVEPANCVVKEEPSETDTKEENPVPHHEQKEVIGGCDAGAEMRCGLVDVSTSQDVTEEMDMEMSDEEEEEEDEEGDLDGRRTPPPRNHPSLTVHLNTPSTPATKHAYFNPQAQVQAHPVSASAPVPVPGLQSPIPLSTSTNTPILATSPSSSSIPSVSSTPSVLFVRPTQQSTGPDPAERQRAMDAWLQIKEQIERETEERARAAAADEEQRRVAMEEQEEQRRATLKQQQQEAAVLRAQQERDREEAARLKHIHTQQQEMARQAEEVERQKREKEAEAERAAEKAAKKEAEETRRREREEEKRVREQEKENERKKTPPHFEAILTNEYMVKMDKKDNEEYTCYCETDCPDKYSPGVEICYNIVCQQECPKNCQAVGCRNRRMANREYAKIEVFDAGPKGHGVRALEKIKKDRLIIEYVGEVMTKDAFEKRKEKYAKHNHTHHYFMSIDKNIVDATKRGNISRFINHSCEPNAYCEPWLVDRRKRMGFFALRDIEVGEEICFDYKFRNYGQNLQQCFCGTAKCTGFIGVWDKDHVAEEEEVEDDDEEEEEEQEEQGRLTKIRRPPRNKYANMDQHELTAAVSEVIRKGLHNQKEALRFMKMVSCVDDHGELQLMIMRFIVQIKEQFIMHCLVKHFLLFLLTSWLRGWMGNLDMMRTDAHLRQRVVAFIMVIMHLPLALDKLDETKEAGDLTQLINDLVALKKGTKKEKEGEEEKEEEEGDVDMEEDENKNEMLQDIASMAERCVVRFQGLSKTAYRIPKKQAAAAPVAAVTVAAEPEVRRERWRMKAGKEAVSSARQSERDSPVDKERGAGWLSGRNTPGGRFSGRNTPNGHSHSGRSTPSGNGTPSDTERRDKETQPVQNVEKVKEADAGEVKPRVPNTIPIPDGEPIIRVDCTTADVRRNIPSWVRQGAMMHHHHTAAPMPFHQMPPPPFQIPPPSMNPMMWSAPPHFMPPMGMGMMAAPPPPPPPAAADNEDRMKERRRSRFDRTADGGALSRAMAEAMKAELDMEGPGLVSCVSVQAKDPELSAITDHEFYRHPLPGSPDVEQLIQWHEAQLTLLRALASQRAAVAAAPGEARVAGASSAVCGEEPMDVALTPVAVDALSCLAPSTSLSQPGLCVSGLSLGVAPVQPLSAPSGPALLPSLHQLPLLPALMAMPPLADVAAAAAAASFLSPTKRPPMTPPEPDVAVNVNVAEEQWLACKDETGDVYYYSDRTREARWDLPHGVTAIAGPGFPAGEAVPQKREGEGEGEGEGDSSRPPSSAGMAAAAAPSQDQVVSTTTQVNSKKEFRCELGKMIQQALKAVHSRMSKGESEFREVARLLNREIVQKEEKLPNCTYEMTRETRGRCMEHIKKVIEYKYPSSATRKKLDEPPSYGPPPTHPQ